jgi:hypothetical protein
MRLQDKKTIYRYELNEAIEDRFTFLFNDMEAVYTLDSIGNITGIAMGTTPIASNITHEPFGGIKSMHYSLNYNINTTITRDKRYQTERIQAGTIVDRTYTHDYSGNIIAMKQNDNDTVTKPEAYAGSDCYGVAGR